MTRFPARRPGGAPGSRAVHCPARPSDDAGFTLAEVMVSMTIMTIVTVMATSAMIQIYRSVAKNEAISVAQAQLSIAFLRLDREIRYASAISAPDAVGADQYVEYLLADTSGSTCVQLRINNARATLERRDWTQTTSTTPLPTRWMVLATQVSSAQAFTFSAADPTYNFDRLQLRLDSRSGNGQSQTIKQTELTFTALNTQLGKPNPTVCTEGRAIP